MGQPFCNRLERVDLARAGRWREPNQTKGNQGVDKPYFSGDVHGGDMNSFRGFWTKKKVPPSRNLMAIYKWRHEFVWRCRKIHTTVELESEKRASATPPLKKLTNDELEKSPMVQ